MGVNLSKGQKVSLEKAAKDSGLAGGIKSIQVGLGWDTNMYDGGFDFDLDASVFLCGADGKVHTSKNFVFYNNLTTNGVEHTGDNRTGAGEGDDEVIYVYLDKIDPDVEKIVVAVTIYEAETRNQNFGQVNNAYIRILDKDSNTEFIRYDLGEDYSIENTVVVGELYKNNGEWKFNAIGSGFSGGLDALLKNFGVN